MSDTGVKQPPERPARTLLTSVSMQTLLVIVAALLVAGTGGVLLSARAVNTMKNHLVLAARDEARLAAENTWRTIGKSLEENPDDALGDTIRRPEVAERLRLLGDQNLVVMACILDEDGRVVYQHFRVDKLSEQQCAIAMVSLANAVPFTDGSPADPQNLPGGLGADLLSEPVIGINLPLARGQTLLGQLHVGVSREMAMRRIEGLSRGISTSLTLMSSLVLVLLAAAAGTLALVFWRHLRALHVAQDSEHFANLGTLAAGFAHEVRNPLHAMNLRLEVLREDLEDPSGRLDRRKALETVAALQGLVGNINRAVGDFARLTLPRQLSLSPVCLDRVVRDVVAELAPEFSARQIEIITDLPERMTIDGDPQALAQVFRDLFRNAIRALESRPVRCIAITGAVWRRGWEIAIEDSGPGLPQGGDSAVFRCLVEKQCGGTGFGLSLARHIMEGHRGSIHGERSARLGGACIVLHFPQGAPVRPTDD